jgi:flagellar basal body P-ring formation protein FlgA
LPPPSPGSIDVDINLLAIMNKFAGSFVALMALTASLASAQNAVSRQGQDPAAVRLVVEQFLSMQTAGLPGQVTVKAGRIDAHTNLAACAAPQAFLPNGSRAWGKTTVGVRCTEPSNWTIYVPATVQVIAEYVATAKPLAQGQTVGEQDLARMKGDLTALPPGVVTDVSAAIGRTLAMSLPSGVPLRQDVLRSQQAVQQGQTVKLITAGPGFQVSTEARALNNAAEGQIAQARTPSGQVVSGVAKAGGVVAVSY